MQSLGRVVSPQADDGTIEVQTLPGGRLVRAILATSFPHNVFVGAALVPGDQVVLTQMSTGDTMLVITGIVESRARPKTRPNSAGTQLDLIAPGGVEARRAPGDAVTRTVVEALPDDLAQALAQFSVDVGTLLVDPSVASALATLSGVPPAGPPAVAAITAVVTKLATIATALSTALQNVEGYKSTNLKA